MIRVQLACDESKPTFGTRCPTFDPPPGLTFKDAADWIDTTLETNGWTTVGDKHLCPLHNPALKGEEFTVGEGAYTEIAPGVRVRIPLNTGLSDLTIEVQRDDRACHGNVGAVCGGGDGPYNPQPPETPPWLARPPLIPGT